LRWRTDLAEARVDQPATRGGYCSGLTITDPSSDARFLVEPLGSDKLRNALGRVTEFHKDPMPRSWIRLADCCPRATCPGPAEIVSSPPIAGGKRRIPPDLLISQESGGTCGEKGAACEGRSPG
jgi:hypothetical protein